jgi:hypothetical protein
MPLFSDFRSDYPLNFALFGCMHMDSMKRPFGALALSSDSVHFQSLIGNNVWFFSCVYAHPSCSRDVPGCDHNRRCFPLEGPTRLPGLCWSKRNPSRRPSSQGLAQTTPFATPTWNCSVEQLKHQIEQCRMLLHGNGEPDFPELMASLPAHKSAGSTIVDIRNLSTLLGYSHEPLAHWIGCLGAHRRVSCDVSSNELTAFLLFRQPPACDVVDVDIMRIPQPRSRSAAVLGEGYESAGMVHETRTRYRWLSLDGLPSFECLISERSGLGLVFDGWSTSAFSALRGETFWQRWRGDELPVRTSLFRPGSVVRLHGNKCPEPRSLACRIHSVVERNQ